MDGVGKQSTFPDLSYCDPNGDFANALPGPGERRDTRRIECEFDWRMDAQFSKQHNSPSAFFRFDAGDQFA